MSLGLGGWVEWLNECYMVLSAGPGMMRMNKDEFVKSVFGQT